MSSPRWTEKKRKLSGVTEDVHVHDYDEIIGLGHTTMNDVPSSKISQTTRNIANDLLNDMNRQVLPVIYIPLPQILNRRSKKPEL